MILILRESFYIRKSYINLSHLLYAGSTRYVSLNRTRTSLQLILLTLGAYVGLILSVPTLAFSQSASSSTDNITLAYQPSANDTTGKPSVNFLTEDEVSQFFKQMNYTITPLTNTTLGNTNNVRTANVENTTYIAWQGNVNNTNSVFLTATYDRGANYSKIFRLAPPDANASELQLFASDNIVSVIWFDHNQTTGKSSIFGSRSTDGGQHFNTYRITFLDTDASNLLLPNHNIVIWTQDDECGGGDGGDGPPPPDNNLPTSSTQNQVGFTEVGLSPGMPPGGVMCAHKW